MEQRIIYVGLDVYKDTIAVALAEAGKRGSCASMAKSRTRRGTVLNFVCGLGTMGRKKLSHGPTQGSQDPGCHS